MIRSYRNRCACLCRRRVSAGSARARITEAAR